MNLVNEATYYFPKLDIAVIAIPKNGCTTLLSYIVDLEESRVNTSNSFVLSQSENCDYSAPNLGIHNYAPIYLVVGPNNLKTKKAHCFFNDPIRRVVSAWLDKVLLLNDPDYVVHSEADWFPLSIYDVPSVFASWNKFVFSLKYQDLYKTDRHWNRQSDFVRDKELLLHSVESINSFIQNLYSSHGVQLASVERLNTIPRFPHFRQGLYEMGFLLGLNEIYEPDYRFSFDQPDIRYEVQRNYSLNYEDPHLQQEFRHMLHIIQYNRLHHLRRRY